MTLVALMHRIIQNAYSGIELDLIRHAWPIMPLMDISSIPLPRWLITILLLIGSNLFMTYAWYGHLKKTGWTIWLAIAASWLIALPEYILQVPANRIGHVSNGGPFTAAQLKIIQEAITIAVFTGFSLVVLKEKLRWNDIAAFGLIFAAVIVSQLGRK